VNVHDIPDEDFKKRVWSGILEFFLKHIHERELLKRWEQIADILPELAKVNIGYDYIEMMLHYTLTFIDQKDKIELKKILANSLNEEKGEEFMISLAQAWKNKGIEIGKNEGIKIGEIIGEARGEARGKIAIIKKMLAKGKDLEEIIEYTELSKEEIIKLKS